MTEIILGDKTILFSYQTPVAYHQFGVGYFKTSTYWSRTTSKHITQWLIKKGSKIGEVFNISQDKLDSLVK